MALNPTDLARIVSMGTPVLMIDSCSLLDLIREPMRQDCKLKNVQAAMAMLHAVETGPSLSVLIAEQVLLELGANMADVKQSAEKAMNDYICQAQHIDRVAVEFGAAGAMSTAHLVDHITRAKAVFDRWMAIGINVPAGPAVAGKAMDRVRHGVAPSRKGKESSKDCFVIESYLEIAVQLNAAGFSAPMVFGSSNTSEYLNPVSKLPPSPLDVEFSQHNMSYGSSHSQMKQMLGI